LEGKNLALEVDGRKHRFTEYGLGVDVMRPMLKGEVEGFKRGLCFTFDATERTVRPAARNNKRIMAFESSETRGLMAKYTVSDSIEVKSEIWPTLETKWKVNQFLENMNLLGERGGIQSVQRFEISDALHEYIQAERNSDKYSKRGEIGEIGENFGVAILIKQGYSLLERHPFDSNGPGPQWYKHRTDSLHSDPTTKEPYLFEFRWWQNSRAAEKTARDEVLNRQGFERVHERWGRISGAYIAIVRLDKGSRIGELRVERVW
jgi:hypothetical protein